MAKKLTLNNLVRDIQIGIHKRSAKVIKRRISNITEEAMLTIPTSGSGYLAKKTKVTSGRAGMPASRADARAAQLKLGRRRRGNSSSDKRRAINTALKKIERMKDERIARVMQRGKGRLATVVFGAFYSGWVSPRYDTGRRRLPKVVAARLKSRRLKNK